MSRPFQFTDKDDISNSPLDRRPQQAYPPGQPPSFKTNVNRTKTRKWAEAKQVSYGGDDWDDYDEDDEYGVSSAVDERPPPIASSQSRSFTTPIPGSAQASHLQRKNSFERDDERRAFSSSNHPGLASPHAPGPPLHVDTAVPGHQALASETSASNYSQSAGARQLSAASVAPSAISDTSTPENRRDFSPSAMPPPLKTPVKTMSPTDATPLSPASAAKRAFVRPSDIYRRMDEERERERRASLDSSRRSIDSARSQELPAAARSQEPESRLESNYRMGAPLEPVAERKSEYGLPGLPTASGSSKPSFTGLPLPALESDSNFGNFWDEANRAKDAEHSQSSTDGPLQHQPSVGYRSMVHQAFDASGNISKQDSTRSQAATESSSLSRSDTTGTSDISPILSGVQSSAPKGIEHRDIPPVIAEEPELDERGRARQSAGSATLADVQPGYRRSLNPPSGTDSPARSPVVEESNPLRGATAAELLTSPLSDKAADSSFREADLAAAASSSPKELNASVAALEKAAQDAFVVTPDVPVEASPRISRSESPTKGRVADLAGKLNEVGSDSRRNSQQSIGSKKSDSSLQDSTSRLTSRPTSSHGPKATERPAAEREVSFRPKIPGGFESFSSTKAASPERPIVSSSPSDIDITPTTTKQPLGGRDISSQSTSSSGPMAALAAAGAAIAASLQSSTGSNDKETASHGRAYGDIYNRPLPPDRLESTASTIPPTPPAKDELPTLVTKDFSQPPRLEHRDTAESTDFESDRLRRDIVRSLSPTEEHKQASSNLAVPETRAPNRHGGTILSEYESYWAGGDEDEEPVMSATSLPSVAAAPLPLKPTKSIDQAKELPASVQQKSLPKEPIPAPTPVPSFVGPASESDSPASARPAGFLTQRFSWEMTPADSPVKERSEPQISTAATTEPSAVVTHNGSRLKPNDPLSLNPKLSSEHLQIRNAEPGELPSPVSARGPSLDSMRELTPKPLEAPVSPIISPVTPTTAGREAPTGPRPLSGHKAHGEGVHDVRPPSFREILAIKSTDVRIAKYNETRQQFANMDTGLAHWLQSTATTTNTDLRHLNAPIAHRPTTGPPAISTSSPGGTRHKATASLTRVFSGPGSDKLTHSPMESTPSPSNADRTQAAALKGKELLGKATVLGGKSLGKGTTVAKGLFAKGKSRFRTSGSEKAHPSDSSLTRRPSVASLSSVSSRSSSIFSHASSRRSSIESVSPSSRRASLDLLFVTSTSASLSSPIDDLSVTAPNTVKKYPKDNDSADYADDDPFWSPEWLRENTDFTVMAIWNRKKAGKEDKPVFGQPSAEENPELAMNTRLNAQRPITPRQGGQPFVKPGGTSPALPSFTFEGKPGSRPSSRSGAPEPPVKGIMKHSNGSSGGLAIPGTGGGRSVSSPLSGSPSGPALKMGGSNSQARIVSMMAHSDDDDEDPPSPVSPVDDEEQHRFPPNGKDALGRSGNLRSVSSTPKLLLDTNTLSVGSQMSRPNSHIGMSMVDSPSRSRVSFQPPEPKGKGKAVNIIETPTSAKPKLRFDPSAVEKEPKGKPVKNKDKGKADADKPSGARKFAPSLIIPMFGGGRGRGRGRGAEVEPATPEGQTPTAQLPQPPFGRGRGRGTPGASTPTSLKPPPSALKTRQPETGQLTPRGRGAGLQRADSQFDRMAAIANAHRMMREQFDEVNGVSETPADIAASENAARMASGPKEHDKLGVPSAHGNAMSSISEERPTSSQSGQTGRSRASSGASIESDARSRSRDAKPTATLGQASQESRSSSMPRFATGGGARQSSIPRPESIVGGERRQSWGSAPLGADNGIGVAVTTPSVLTISKGMSPVTQVSSSSLGDLPSQQRRSSMQNVVHSEPRLSAGPGPTLRSESPASQDGRGTPTMVITSPQSSPPRKVDPPTSIGAQSQHSGTSPSINVSSPNSKGSASPVHPGTKNGLLGKVSGSSYERPMSYVLLDRDDRGFVSEKISTAKNPIDEGSDAEDEATTGAEPAMDKRTLDRLMGNSSDRSGQTSRSSVRTDDDEVYKQPSPKSTLAQTTELEKETSNTKTGKHRSVQLYDRPFSRDESASGASTPSQKSQATGPTPDTNPIAHQQVQAGAPPSKKGGLLGKMMGKPPAGPVAAVVANGHSQSSSRDTTNTSSEEPRLSSMTSTTASFTSEVKEKKGRRGSGFFSLKRPSSTEPLMIHERDDTIIPPHNQVRINTNVPSAPSPASAGPRRSATSAEPTKKRRGTLGALFSRSGNSGAAPQAVPPVPQKPSAKNTIFHRVPNNTNPPAQAFSGPRSGSSTPGGNHPPSSSRPSSSADRPSSFVHKAGASGHEAIAAQQKSGITTTISSEGRRERRSMSLTGSGGLFGRRRRDSSPSGNSTHDRSDSIESTTKLRKGRKLSKSSISDAPAGQHQERPWAIMLPGGEDNDPQTKAIERAEIMHAASSRRELGPDGRMHSVEDESLHTLNSATPVSPRSQQIPPPQGYGGPGNQVFSYLPSGVNKQQGQPNPNEVQSPDFYSPQSTLPPPQHYPARPAPRRMGHEQSAESIKESMKQGGHQNKRMPLVAQPVIPPLPQGDVPLRQPQPRRTSWQADANDPRMDPSYRSQGAARSTTTTAATSQSPRSPRNQPAQGQQRPVDYSPRPPTGEARRHQGPGSQDGPPLPATARPSGDRRPSIPMKDRTPTSPRLPRMPSSGTGTPSADTAKDSHDFVASLEEERRKHGDHTGQGKVGPSNTKSKRDRGNLTVNVPSTSSTPPPQVGILADTSAAVASTSMGGAGSRRGRRETNDDSAPVMKATSFPGDEWVPEFYYE